MSEVNSIQPAAYPQAFRGEKAQQSSSSPVVPSLLVGGAAAAGTVLWGGKKMDVDTFYSNLKDKKEIAFSKDLEGEAKTKFEAAKTAAEANVVETSVSTGTQSATDVQVKAYEDALKTNERSLEKYDNIYKKGQVGLEMEKQNTQAIQDVYEKVENFTTQKQKLEKGEKAIKLQNEKATISQEIELLEKNKANRILTKGGDESIIKAIDEKIIAKKQEINAIDSKLLEHSELKTNFSKQIAEDFEKNKIKKINETVNESQKALKEAAKETKEATTDLNKANKALKDAETAKKPEAEIKALKEKVVVAENKLHQKSISELNASMQHEMNKEQQKFLGKVKNALEIPDNIKREKALAELHTEQVKRVSLDGKSGKALEEMEKFKKSYEELFSNIDEMKTDKAKFMERTAKFEAHIGETARNAVAETKAAGEAAKKEIPTVIKEGFEAVKDNLKKVKPGALKIAGFGAGAAVLTYIIAKMAGGKKSEQA